MTQNSIETALVPFDLEAERRVVGAMVVNRNLIPDTILNLKPDSFYGLANKMVFEAISTLYLDGHPVNHETIANFLKTHKIGDKTKLQAIGGARQIVEITEGVDGSDLEYWTNVVKNKAEARSLLFFAEEAKRVALSNPENVREARARLEEKLVSLNYEERSTSISMGVANTALDDIIQRYIDNPDGILGMETGFESFDKCLDGIRTGNVYIVYAPSSRFKSLFSASVGWRLAHSGHAGLWFTTEMPWVQVTERVLQFESRLNLKWLRSSKTIMEHEREIADARKRLSGLPIFFCDTSTLDVADVRAEISRHKRWHDVKYIIVDLVDHVFSSRFKEEMVNNQRVVMSSMKAIAKDMDVGIILVSHVSKGNFELRKKADLDVEEMVGSAAKYQDVDCSMSIAPVTYNGEGRMVAMSRDDIIYTMTNGGIFDVLVSITKNRHGPLEKIMFKLDFNKGGFFYES